MSSNQIAELSKDISNLEISEEEKEKKALQETLTMSYMYAHEPFATLPPQYRVRRHFRPIPPKFVYGFGVSNDELTPLAVKVKPVRGTKGDPARALRDYFDTICGQKPTFECVYSRDSEFVLGLANTYSNVNEKRVIAAKDKLEAELVRLEWPRTKCMWFIAEANNVDREDWFNPDPEYDEADDEANAYLSILASRASLARSKRSSNQIAERSKDISNLEISVEEKEKKRAFQMTLTMSYMYAHEPFATLPPQYRVRRHFRPIPPKFVYGFGVSIRELVPLAVKVKPVRRSRADPSRALRDYFDSVCGQKPTFERVYSRESTFVLGLANTYSNVKEPPVLAARDKLEAELVRLEWPRTKCMWFISGANNVEREDWYNPDPEYDEADDEANAYLSMLAARANLARSKRSAE